MQRILAAGAGAVAAATAAVTRVRAVSEAEPSLLDDKSLNQPAGVGQSLQAWQSVTAGGSVYVERKTEDPAKRQRFKCPDGANLVNGVPHPFFIQQAPWDAIAHTGRLAKPGDIWVATFPKCGTTFTEQIILLLLNGGDPSKLDPKTQNTYNPETGVGKVWVEQLVRTHIGLESDKHDKWANRRMNLDEFAAVPSPRVLKTHAPRQLFLGVKEEAVPSITETGRPTPLAPGTKVVYVSRNPKDACVSSYYHAANPQKMGIPFDAWVYVWLNGLFESGRWADHLAGWRAEALSNPQQVLWVRYEDLKADPEHEIRRIAKFLEVPASDKVIQDTMVNSGFKAMKTQSGGYQFFRKGVVGDWMRHFSPELAAEFDAQIADQLRGVDNPYGSSKL